MLPRSWRKPRRQSLLRQLRQAFPPACAPLEDLGPMLIMSNQHSKKLFVVEAAEELPSTANPMCCFLFSWSWRLMSLLSCFQVLATSAILGGAAGGESFSFVLGKTWLCHHFFPTQFLPLIERQVNLVASLASRIRGTAWNTTFRPRLLSDWDVSRLCHAIPPPYGKRI